MPLVEPDAAPLDAPLSDAHGRARKIDPSFTEGELVRVAGGRNQAEAELIGGLLLEEGIPSLVRRAAGSDVPDFLAAGQRDVLVPESGAGAARELLAQVEAAAPAPRTAGSGAGGPSHALRLAAAIAISALVAAFVAWILVTATL
jgi:hypothetical protein